MSQPDEACPACGAEVLDIDVSCGKCGYALSSTGAQRLIGEVVLGQYSISDVLGQGGMSVVYRGKHLVTGQEVALKVLPPDLAAYRDVKDRFLEEGRALAQLDHPNIVHLYNFGSDGDSLVLAMQLVRGKTWERVIMEAERLSWQHSAKLTCDVSRALDYAHGRGIIHRDMKPSNVLIRELDGAATVMDFGIAKVQSSTKLTATGQTMGTVRYMSPEQVRGKPVDERTDIYSLAITTYESVVGDTPFTGDTHFEIMTKHLSELPVPPSQRGIDVSPAFERVLMRAISKAPDDRQRTAKEFTEQLEAALEGSSAAPISFDKTMPLGSAGHQARPSADSQATVPGKKLSSDSEVSEPSDEQMLAEITRGGRRNIIIGLALAVLAAGAATVVMTQGGTSDAPKKPVVVAAVELPDAAPKSVSDMLAEAFVLPGMQFAVDESFADESFRLLSVDKVSVEKVREMVAKAQADYTSLSKEQGWPESDLGQPLTLALVPQSALCNPGLYEKGGAPGGCRDQAAWIRPREHTLYLVSKDTKKMPGLLRYWVAMTNCIGGSVANCTDVIQDRVGE